MRSTRIRAATLALAAFASLVPFTTFAQTQVPDIRGHYVLGGSVAVYDCTFGEVNDVTPLSYAPVDITSQDGDRFSGGYGTPQAGGYAIAMTGTVSPTGALSGTWNFTTDPTGGSISDEVLTGQYTDGKLSLHLTAVIGNEFASCQYRIDLTQLAALLTFQPPDPSSMEALPPPRALTLTPLAPPSGVAAAIPSSLSPWPAASRPAGARDGAVTGYNIYRSSTPNVTPTPENLFVQVGPAQTTVPTTVDPTGSFFVVTATYATGESNPSNEVSGGVPAATITSVKVSATKLKAVGKDFSSTVQVFIDGIPFTAPAKVKGGTKVNQKGNLINGQSIAQYATSGKTVAITFRNSNGGVATYLYTAP